MKSSWWLAAMLASLTGLSANAQAPAGDKADRLDRAAPKTTRIDRSPLFGVTRAGQRLVAVGIRGLIIVSDDHGLTWRQVPVPVAVDLLAVQFPSPRQGWAVGHDGVVLHSADGGDTWVKQLDGRQTAVLLNQHFAALVARGDAEAAKLAPDVKLNYENGPEQALLDVWFEDELHGFVAGSFGTLLRTSDGGKTWTSWMERVDSDTLYHYNAIRGIAGDIYIASEKGVVYRLDRVQNRFRALRTGYAGSILGVVGDAQKLLALGLRGNAFRSRDRGQTWEKADTGTVASLTAASLLDDGRIVMVSQDGQVRVSDPAGSQFAPLQVARPTLLTGAVAAGGADIALIGLNGVQRVSAAPVR